MTWTPQTKNTTKWIKSGIKPGNAMGLLLTLTYSVEIPGNSVDYTPETKNSTQYTKETKNSTSWG